MASWRTVVLLLVLLFLARDEILTEADVQQFEEFFKSKGLKLLHQNVRGLFTNFSELETLFCKHTDIDISGVTETHINRDVPNGFFNIENYQFISRPRTTGIGVGFGVYVYQCDDPSVFNILHIHNHWIDTRISQIQNSTT